MFPHRDTECEVDGTNRLWVADLRYITILGGFVYLAAVMDVWSRRIVGRQVNYVRRVRCRESLCDQGLHLIRDFSYPSSVADFCGPGVGHRGGWRISTP